MRKIFTMVFTIFSVIVLGGYIISMASVKEKVQYKMEDISGSREVLGSNKVKVEINDGFLDVYEIGFSKDKEELNKKDIDAASLNISEEQFKDKELFRGMKFLKLKPFEDDQYKILVNSVSEYDNKTANVVNNISVSCRNKKTDKLKKFKVSTPNKYSYIDPISIFNEKGNIKIVFVGHEISSNNNGNNRKLELCSINIEKETIKSEKKIDLKKIISEDVEHIRAKIYNDRKVYLVIEQHANGKEGEARILSINMKDSSIKEYKYAKDKPREEVKGEIEENTNIYKDGNNNGIFTNDNKIIFFTVSDGKMDMTEFDTKNEQLKKYNTINLDDKIYGKEKDKNSEIKDYWCHRIIKIQDNYVYVEIKKGDSRTNNSTAKTYLNILDLNKNKSVYLGKIDISSDYLSIKIEN